MASDVRALGHQQITNLAAATALTIPQGCSYAIITAQTQAVRWRDDGTDPTSSVGYPLDTGVELFYDAQLGRLKFIEQASGGAINVAYYGIVGA